MTRVARARASIGIARYRGIENRGAERPFFLGSTRDAALADCGRWRTPPTLRQSLPHRLIAENFIGSSERAGKCARSLRCADIKRPRVPASWSARIMSSPPRSLCGYHRRDRFSSSALRLIASRSDPPDGLSVSFSERYSAET